MNNPGVHPKAGAIHRIAICLCMIFLLLVVPGRTDASSLFAGATTTPSVAPRPHTDSPRPTMTPIPEPEMTEEVEDSLEVLLDEAWVLGQEGEFEAAFDLIDEAIVLAPDDPRPFELRGFFQFSQDEIEEAIADLETAASLGMESTRGYGLLANLYSIMGEYEKELDAAMQAVSFGQSSDSPEEPWYLGNLYKRMAEIRLMLGDAEGAIADATQAIEQGSTYSLADAFFILSNAYRTRSEALYGQGDTAGAIADLEAAITWNPWFYSGFQILNELRQEEANLWALLPDDLTTTLDQLNQQIEAEPTDAAALYERGMLYLALVQAMGDVADLQAALADFSAAIEADPTFAPAYHGRAVINGMLALDAVARVSSATGGFSLEQLLAIVDRGVGELNISLGTSDLSIQGDVATITDQNGITTTLSLEEWIASLEEIEAESVAVILSAQTDFEQALALDPESAEANHDQAVFKFGQWRPAVEGLAIGMLEEDDRALLNDAVSGFDQAVTMRPDWPQARLNRGLANLFLGLFTGIDSFSGEEQDPKLSAQAVVALESAVADAEWLIEQETENGWAYYMRALGLVLQSELGVLEIDGELEIQLAEDEERFVELVPDANWDYIDLQASQQVGFSSLLVEGAASTSPPLIASGELDLTDDGLFYANAEYGIRLAVPDQATNGTVQAVAVQDGPLWVLAQDDFRVFPMLVLQPDLSNLTLEEWLQDTFLTIHVKAVLMEEPLSTPYGPALVVRLGEEGEGDEEVLVFLQVGEQVFSFDFQLGVYSQDSDVFAKGYGLDLRPMDRVVGDLFLGLEIDGVDADLSLVPDGVLRMADDARTAGRYEKAVSLYEQVLAVEPQNGFALNNLAWTLAYHLEQELEQALEYALAAVEDDPNPARLDTLGLVYTKLGQYDEAIQVYSRALAINPDSMDSYVRRGDAYAALGQTEEAIADYERFLDAAPESAIQEEVRAKIDALR